MSDRRSPKEWFKIWRAVIEKERVISRVDLADLTNCSLWTIKALSKDFINTEAYIIYKNGRFEWWTPRIEQTLSLLSEQDRDELK